MQALKQPTGFSSGFTVKKIVLLILTWLDNPAKKSDIVEQYLILMRDYEGKEFRYKNADTKVDKALNELVTRHGKVKRPERGKYEITYHGILALRKLDIDHGIPDELRPKNLHDYYSPSLDGHNTKIKQRKPKTTRDKRKGKR